MTTRLEAISFEVSEPAVVAAFWAGLLQRTMIDESSGALVPGDDTQLGLRFVPSRRRSTTRPRLHLHLTSDTIEDQQRTVARALALRGRHLDVGQSPEDEFVVLADPAGTEFCVIEPDNDYLRGCGRLGEVTCSGSPTVGRFWRDALHWPLVWDAGAQTAIQSPSGGTKISWDAAWDAPVPRPGHDTVQRFDLVGADPGSEALRLESLGAVRVRSAPDGELLVDPDGNRFVVRLEG